MEILTKEQERAIREEVKSVGDICKNQGDNQEKPKVVIDPKKIYERGIRAFSKEAKILAENEGKIFTVGENGKIFQFFVFYFLGMKQAEYVFPKQDYKLNKNCILIGNSGSGKSFLFRLFSELTKKGFRPFSNNTVFENVSIPKLINYYQVNGHMDLYTYNDSQKNQAFEGKPVNLCINDIGLNDFKHYGESTKSLITDLFHARMDLYETGKVKTHITTNLTMDELNEYFDDDFGRIKDRMKYFNVIPFLGDSLR